MLWHSFQRRPIDLTRAQADDPYHPKFRPLDFRGLEAEGRGARSFHFGGRPVLSSTVIVDMTKTGGAGLRGWWKAGIVSKGQVTRLNKRYVI